MQGCWEGWWTDEHEAKSLRFQHSFWDARIWCLTIHKQSKWTCQWTCKRNSKWHSLKHYGCEKTSHDVFNVSLLQLYILNHERQCRCWWCGLAQIAQRWEATVAWYTVFITCSGLVVQSNNCFSSDFPQYSACTARRLYWHRWDTLSLWLLAQLRRHAV